VPLDPVQIYETVEMRKIHEIKAAELACERATEENFERLREILERVGGAARAPAKGWRGGP
jgi:DNA-binding FadR family transcriptional regulator